MKITKNNLINMMIRAVALVDRGANKKTFFLVKREETKMKEKILAIIKAGKLEEAQLNMLLDTLKPEERKEVEFEIAKATEDTAANKLVEEIIEKAGAKFSKDTATALQSILAGITELKTKLESIVTAKAAEGKGEEMCPKCNKPIKDCICDNGAGKDEVPYPENMAPVKKYLENPELEVEDKDIPLLVDALAFKANYKKENA